MASPFTVLRRNQTAVMASLVVVAIISFIVAPSIQMVLSSNATNMRSGPLQGTLVQWRSGSIDSTHFEKLTRSSYRCRTVLNRLADETLKAGGMPKVPNFTFDQRSGNPVLDLTPPGASLIRRKLLSEKAKELGIVVSDDTVAEYLRSLTDGRISNTRLAELMREQDRLSKHELYEYIKEELSANLLERAAMSGVSSRRSVLLTPSHTWQLFQRFQQRAKIEAFPVLVDDLIAQVTSEPSDADLQGVYQLGSGRFPDKSQPLPGFMRRYRADVEFVSGNMESFLAPEKAKITEEEIQKAYDQRVKEGRFQVPVGEASGAVQGEINASPTIEPPEQGAPPSTDGASKSEGASSVPAPVEEKKEGGDEKKEPANEQSGASEKEGGEKKENAQSNLLKENATRLVSFQESASASTTSQEKSPTQEAASAPAASTPAVSPAPTAAGPVSSSGPELNPISQIDLPTATPTDASTATPPKPAMRTQTLEEVRDQLVRDLAFPAASKKMKEALDQVTDKMTIYFEELNIYQRSVEAKDSSATKPESIDLQKMADELGLVYGKTGMVDSESVMTLPIGRSRIQFQFPFGPSVLQPNAPLYQPGTSLDFDFTNASRTDYVFWKTEEKQATLPELSEIREEVKAAWKRQEAQKLAEKKAVELVKKLEQVDQDPWAAVLSESERGLIVNPPAFSWMMPSFSEQSSPQLSPVDQIDMAGSEFMKRVFATPPGKFVVAANQPQTILYVVRMVERTPTEAELRTQFERTPIQRDTRALGFMESQPILNEWYGELERDLKVQWMISPEQLDQMN